LNLFNDRPIRRCVLLSRDDCLCRRRRARPVDIERSHRDAVRLAPGQVAHLDRRGPRASDVHFEPPLTEYWYDVIAAPPLDDGARTTRSKPPTNADSLPIVARRSKDCRRWWEASTSWCALHRPMGRRDHVVPVLGERWFEVDVTRARGHVDQGEQPDQGQGVPRRGASAQCQRGGRGVGDKGNRHAKVIRTA